jgi:hypothetical protein
MPCVAPQQQSNNSNSTTTTAALSSSSEDSIMKQQQSEQQFNHFDDVEWNADSSLSSSDTSSDNFKEIQTDNHLLPMRGGTG